MAEQMKTIPNDADVSDFLASIADERRREETTRTVRMMTEVTGEEPRMWGDSIVGFGSYSYKRRDGSSHEWMLTGVAPRKAALTVYIMPGFSAYEDLLQDLGKHKHSVSCLYISRLANVDFAVLTELVRRSVVEMRRRYAEGIDYAAY